MGIFEFDDYKVALRAFVSALPGKGRGELGRMARAMRIHPTMVSQILNGPKHLTLEQACVLTEHMGLNDAEGDYFLALIEYERAGSDRLRYRVRRRLASLRAAGYEVKNRLPKKPKPLTEPQQAIFYSDWYYSAARLLTSIPRFQSVDAIATHLGMPRAILKKAVDFLLEAGLCKPRGDAVEMGPQRTHIPKDSPFFKSHHRNWRMRALQKLDQADTDDLFFTGPLTISRADSDRIRKRLLDVISEVAVLVEPSSPEELCCLNVEYFKI